MTALQEAVSNLPARFTAAEYEVAVDEALGLAETLTRDWAALLPSQHHMQSVLRRAIDTAAKARVQKYNERAIAVTELLVELCRAIPATVRMDAQLSDAVVSAVQLNFTLRKELRLRGLRR